MLCWEVQVVVRLEEYILKSIERGGCFKQPPQLYDMCYVMLEIRGCWGGEGGSWLGLGIIRKENEKRKYVWI